MMAAAAASVFLFLALALGALAWLRQQRVLAGPADRRLRGLRVAGEAAGAPGRPTLRRPQTSLAGLLGSGWAEKTERDLRQANVQLRIGEYLAIRVLCGLGLFAIVLLVGRAEALAVVLGLVLGAVGFFLPGVYVRVARSRRRDRLERQLVDLAPMLASALRSGFALQQGLELAARQLEPPMADELAQLGTDINLGATMEDALLDFGRRVGSLDLDMLITAILVQRLSGGNLSEVLDQTAETLRERERIRGEVKTFTAQQRLTGLILSVYPAAIGLLLLAIMPSMWKLMFTEPVGQTMLGIALGLQVIGFIAIRRVMDIEV